jgi:SWI/SNF-related matrix-associated actin-dependent regulator of chromatin subfamily A3
MWLSEITQSSQSTPPTPVVGGILADEMGIGKTLQTLGLILANPPEDRDYNVPKSEKPPARKMPSKTALSKLKPPALTRVLEDARVSPMPSTTKTAMVNACMDGLKQGTISIEQYYRSTEAPKTTLIVCPVSVMSNWTTQINDHVRENTLRVEIYHGPGRHDLLSNLNDIDVLIASYNTISYDFADLDKANKRNGKEPQ